MIVVLLAVGLWVGWWAVFVRYRPLGLMTVDRFMALRLSACTLDGGAITDRCAAADDRQGWALLYVHQNERCYLNDQGRVAMEVRVGAVRFT